MLKQQLPVNLSCKVMVIGSPGSGKTTLTRQLAQAGRMLAVHLDDVYWQENWKEPDSASWEKQVAQLITGEHWLIDGNHAPTLPARINRADIIILVDTPAIICLYRLISRVIRIMSGQIEHLPIRIQKQVLAGEKVSLTSGVIDFYKLLRTAFFFREQRRRIMELIAESNRSPVLITIAWHIGHSVDIDKLLKKILTFGKCQGR